LLPHAARHPEPVAFGRIRERKDHQLGLGLERARIRRPLSAVLGNSFQRDGRAVTCAAVEAHRGFEQVERLLGLSLLRQQVGKGDKQQRPPRRVLFEFRSRVERFGSERRVVRSTGEHLELEPGRRVRRALGRGLHERRPRCFVVLLVVRRKRGALHQRARFFDRRFGDAKKRVEKLRQVLDRFSSLEQPHQSLERLAKLRVRVERRQKFACRFHLVARALLCNAELVQEQRFLVRVGRAVLFRLQVRGGMAGRKACRMTRRARGIRHTRAVQFRGRMRVADQADACR
jgi:hypothetical protein